MGTIVYRYGLLAPIEHNAEVREQMRNAHNYRNTLVQIERGRRNAVRSVMSQHIGTAETDAAASDKELEEALGAIKASRKQTRSRSETDAMKERVTAVREKRKQALLVFREKRAALRAEDGECAKALTKIEDLAAEIRKNARANCKTFWGSYLLIEDADMASRKMPLYDGAEPNDPRFVRWRGDGRVGVQIQHGMTSEQLMKGEDRRLKVGSIDEQAWYAEKRGDRRRASRTTISLRIGSVGRDPIWGTWPMVMHRPIPKDGIIKCAAVSLRMRGPREEWSVEITVTTPDEGRISTCGEGAVAINFGWRVIGDEIRVATWKDTDGKTGELRLPPRLIGGFAKVEDLASIRDKNFNKAKEQLAFFLVTLKETPAWMVEGTKYLLQWRSINRLTALVQKWKKNRFDGDMLGFDVLEAWRYNDHHLWCWEENQRISSLRRRKDIYRCFAAQLAKTYKILVLGDFDLRSVAKKPRTESGKVENDTARHSRQLAAVSEMRLILEQAFNGRGGDVKEVSSENITQICHVCGLNNDFDAASCIDHECSVCHLVWDQDKNACINMLKRFHDGSPESEDKKEKKEQRWAKAKRMKEEKENKKAMAAQSPAN